MYLRRLLKLTVDKVNGECRRCDVPILINPSLSINDGRGEPLQRSVVIVTYIWFNRRRLNEGTRRPEL